MMRDQMHKSIPCPRCQGPVSEFCEHCLGSGRDFVAAPEPYRDHRWIEALSIFLAFVAAAYFVARLL